MADSVTERYDSPARSAATRAAIGASAAPSAVAAAAYRAAAEMDCRLDSMSTQEPATVWNESGGWSDCSRSWA